MNDTPEYDFAAPTMPEKDFMPAKVLPLDLEAREHKKSLKRLAHPSKTLVRGGKRVFEVKCKIPIEQYSGLQRFEGDTDSDKMLMILRMANRRVDEVEKQSAEAQAKAQEIAPSVE